MNYVVYNKYSFDKWSDILKQLPSENKDLYFLPEYYSTWIEHEDAEPYCFVASIDDVIIIYPFFKKLISRYDLSKNYYDIFSAYGYGGTISNKKQIPKNIKKEFNKLFGDWCQQNNIIAELIRCNPLIDESINMVRNVDYVKIRTNVYAKIDNNYIIPSKGTQQTIRSTLNKGVFSEIDIGLKTIDNFQKLYALTSERLNMKRYYLFKNSYFNNQKKFLEKYCTIINVKNKRGEIISSALLYFYEEKAIYHLSGSDYNYKKLSPNDFLILSIIEESKRRNISILNLGGGTTNFDNDGLYNFKKKFGNLLAPVYIGKRIVNGPIYSKLLKLWSKKYPQLINKYSNYLLKYREVI